MRNSSSALRLMEDPEQMADLVVANQAGEDEAPSVWERVALVFTLVVGSQLALLALLGL